MQVRSFVLFCFLCWTALAASREEAGLSLQGLRTELNAHVSQPRFRSAQWGIKIVSLDSGTVLFEATPEKLLKPASNAKLYTGALALDQLGPEFQIRTSLYAKNAPDSSGILESDLIVYGRGDPSFSTRFEGVTYGNLVARIVDALQRAGVKQIRGDVVGDSSFLSGGKYGGSWSWEDLQYYYGAEISALCLQDNAIDLFLTPGETAGEPCKIVAKPVSDFLQFVNQTRTTAAKTSPSIAIQRSPGDRRVVISGTLPKNYGTWTDAVTVPNPTLWFAIYLKAELDRRGVKVGGSARTVEAPTDPRSLTELAAVVSPPISTIIEKTLKPSQNLYAQLLLLQVGAQRTRNSAPGSVADTCEEQGLKELRAFLKRAEIEPGEVAFDDGAGLSRSDLVTADATVKLLTFMAKHRYGGIYRAALPEAGSEGTLQTRLKELKGNLRAKTGSLRFINTLSGYMVTRAGENLAFCLMLNAYNGPGGGRDEVDQIPRLLARLNERTSAATAKPNESQK